MTKKSIGYIGGCCGFEAYHIRAVSEELCKERGGKVSKGSEKHDTWGGGLVMHTKPWVRARARKSYWEKLSPASGRPFCPSMSIPDNWGVSRGSELLKQHKEHTMAEEMEAVFAKNGKA